MTKVHWIGAGGVHGWASTACGMEGRATKDRDTYDGWGGKIITAKYRTWEGVTCGRCLKNPFSPQGRVALLTKQQNQA